MPMPGNEEDGFDDISADLRAAFEEHSAPEPSPAPAPEPSPSPSPAPSPATDGRQRDQTGRFKARGTEENPDEVPENSQSQAQAPAPSAQAPVAGPIPPAPPPAKLRPPVSWRPEHRETWNQLSEAHQQEITRREREITETLNHTAEARRFHEEFSRAVQPYAHVIQAEGSTPIQAVQHLMQTAMALRTAPAPQKAQMVGDMILQFGVDLETLDSYLSSRVRGGQFTPGPQAGIQQMIQQQLQPLQQFMQRYQETEQQRQQRVQSEAQQQLDDFFADPANEFAEDVREDMADLIDMAARRGRKMSLQDAYTRATLAHPTISKIVESRKTASQSAQHSAAAQRARNAAVSLPSGGAPSQGGDEDDDDGSIRSAIAASMRQHQRPVR